MHGTACCRWKLGANDAVDDPADGATYCATCWQKWLDSERARKPRKVVTGTDTGAGKDKSGEGDGDEGQEPELEGVVHSDGTLYLVDRAGGTVYSSERDDSGELVLVGTLGEGGVLELRPRVAQFSTEASDNCETPDEAYSDLAPLLRALASLLGKTAATLRIWDRTWA